MHNGEPSILIEAKMAGTPLDKEEPSQLFRYFTALGSASFGIYTDGVKYRFYTDVDKQNVMDTSPFMTLDLASIEPEALELVSRFANGVFAPNDIRDGANELKYVRVLKNALHSMFESPSEEIVKALMTDVYEGVKTGKAVERFTDYTRTAMKLVIDEKVRNRLNAAINVTNEQTQYDDLDSEDEEISDAEINAFSTVKALLYDVIDVGRLHLREMSGYTMVLVDDTIQKPICKLKLRHEPYSVEIASREDGKRVYNSVQMESVEGLYSIERELEEVAKEYA